MAKRKMTEINFNPKKTKFIDIIYSEFDSDQIRKKTQNGCRRKI